MISAFVSRQDPSTLSRLCVPACSKSSTAPYSKSCPELLRLLVHPHNELRPVNSVRKSGEIFHRSRRGQLAARLSPFQNKGREVGTGGINRAGQACASRANDDDIFHIARGINTNSSQCRKKFPNSSMRRGVLPQCSEILPLLIEEEDPQGVFLRRICVPQRATGASDTSRSSRQSASLPSSVIRAFGVEEFQSEINSASVKNRSRPIPNLRTTKSSSGSWFRRISGEST